MKRTLVRAGIGIASLLFCEACDDGPPNEIAVARDSAGIRIIENSAAAWDIATPWRLSEEPVVRIGTVEGDPSHQFDRIMGVRRLSDGRIVIGDMGSSQLRFYDRTGRHLRTVGRNGAGPGEFRQIMAVTLLRGDTIAVDDRRDRVQLFDDQGVFVGVLLPRTYAPGYPSVRGTFDDGKLIVSAMQQPQQDLAEPQTLTITFLGVTRAPAPNLAAPATDRTSHDVIDTIASFEALRLVPGWRGELDRIVFGPFVIAGVAPDGIYVADPARYEIRKHGPGGELDVVMRRPWTPVPVTPQDIERYRTAFVNMAGEGGGAVPPRLRQQREDIMKATTFANHFPAFSRMMVDKAGNIWLRDYDASAAAPIERFNPTPDMPTRWTVFSRDGAWLGAIETPARFLLMDIGEDYVAGLARDEMGPLRFTVRSRLAAISFASAVGLPRARSVMSRSTGGTQSANLMRLESVLVVPSGASTS